MDMFSNQYHTAVWPYQLHEVQNLGYEDFHSSGSCKSSTQ